MKKQSYLFLKEGPEANDPEIPRGAPRPENLDYSQYKGQKFTERKEAVIGYFDRQFLELRADKINEDKYYNNLKNINLSFALDTGFNFFKFNAREPNRTLYSVEELKNNSKTSSAVIDKISANKIISDNYGYLSIIDNFYSLLEQGKIKIINLGGPTGGLPQLVVPNPNFNKGKPADKKNIENLYVFNLDPQSFSSFAGEGKYKDITVEKLVEVAYIFYNDKKAMAALNKSSPPPAPAKPEKGKGGGTGGGGKVPPQPQPQSGDMKCGKLINIKNDHPLVKPPASDIGQDLQIQLKKFWGRIGTDTLSDKDVLQKLYDCKIGPTTRKFTISTLESVEKDIDEAISKLEAAIKDAEGSQPTKESRRLEDLYKLLSERLRVNKAKSNWLFEAEGTPTTPAATTTPPSGDIVRTATAVSTTPVVTATAVSQVKIAGQVLTIDQAKEKVKELQALKQEAIAAKEALAKETRRVVKTTIDKATAVLKKHETTQSAVYSLKLKPTPTPAPAGGGGKPEPAPAPQVPAVPRTQEASCWFTFNENVRGTPNTTPTDLWNQARARTGDQTMLSWEAWEEIAKKVITDKAANPSYNFTTGTLTPFKAQVELLIQRKDVNINLGCFRTIFGNVRDVLLSLLESSKQNYEQLEPERKENFLKSVSQFLIKSGNSVVYENTNVHKMYVTLEKVIEYSNFLTRQIIKTATTGIADGKLNVSFAAVLPANDRKNLLDAAAAANVPGATAAAAALAAKPAGTPAPAGAPAGDAAKPAGTPAPAGTPPAAGDAAKTAPAPAGTPAGAPAGDVAKPAETPAGTPAQAGDVAKPAETPAKPAETPAKPAETPAKPAETPAGAPAAGAGAPARAPVKPDPKAEEVVNKAEEVTKAAAAKQEAIQQKADQVEAIKKKAEEQRNAPAIAKAEAAQKVLEDKAKKAREEANAALKAAQDIIIKTHNITQQEIQNNPELQKLLNTLATDGDQYTQIIGILNKSRTVTIKRSPAGSEETTRAVQDKEKKDTEAAEKAKEKAADEAKKQAQKKEVEEIQKINDPKQLTIEQAQKLYFVNYDNLAEKQVDDTSLSDLRSTIPELPMPGSLIEKQNIPLISRILKKYIDLKGPLSQNLLYYTMERSERSGTNPKNNRLEIEDTSIAMSLIFDKNNGDPNFIDIYAGDMQRYSAFDLEKHVTQYKRKFESSKVAALQTKLNQMNTNTGMAGAGGKPPQQQESLKEKREWLLHEALFKKLVKRNG